MTDNIRVNVIPRTNWTPEQLQADRLLAEEEFRRQRLEEDPAAYHEQFDELQGVMEDFLESTVDLSQLADQALAILADENQLVAFRYLAAPPISIDDLKTLAETNSLAPTRLQQDPDLVRRLVTTIRSALDRRRFPWVSDGREPTDEERKAAVIASTALIAAQRIETERRTMEKRHQEDRIRSALLDFGFIQITVKGKIGNIRAAPKPGEFCREVVFGDRKADFVVGLWDGRIMPIEAKVSNSATNSVKRLNNDAAVKAVSWIRDFGALNVAPTAVISGVYKLHNLEQAQNAGLTIYWAHRLSDLTEWIERTRTSH